MAEYSIEIKERVATVSAFLAVGSFDRQKPTEQTRCRGYRRGLLLKGSHTRRTPPCRRQQGRERATTYKTMSSPPRKEKTPQLRRGGRISKRGAGGDRKDADHRSTSLTALRLRFRSASLSKAKGPVEGQTRRSALLFPLSGAHARAGPAQGACQSSAKISCLPMSRVIMGASSGESESETP